ncbi:hypothetical protein SAMN05421780_101344 [Flexibacter flexilis DSM 6793]|uniref:Uncharacterized protein n=1 Tax=Flexibacter flexilis DSM 6793 TaxID=927664 RepID=A0A1I1DN83_9BACT|nr:hypothetical protein [Flexibacter flexilis]SFB76297.1 hypothetical protein SAMN05421780_101344 [Flexibacter flexilis DSM 6793]
MQKFTFLLSLSAISIYFLLLAAGQDAAAQLIRVQRIGKLESDAISLQVLDLALLVIIAALFAFCVWLIFKILLKRMGFDALTTKLMIRVAILGLLVGAGTVWPVSNILKYKNAIALLEK